MDFEKWALRFMAKDTRIKAKELARYPGVLDQEVGFRRPEDAVELGRQKKNPRSSEPVSMFGIAE
jgi:hypothetical protein